ncbi:MAG: putative rane protein [Dactylosporangium sp.]|nr:putative rane protein [Dactylosporangium sp.]
MPAVSDSRPEDDNPSTLQLPPGAAAADHQSASVDDHHRLAEAVQKALHGHLAEHLTRVEQICASSVRDAVATGRRRLDDVMRDHPPAWLRPTEGEPRWPVALAIVVAIGLQLAIPARLAIPPRWLLPALELALLIVLTVANPRRINLERRWLRLTSLALVALASIANTYSAARLVWRLIHGGEGSDAGPLLAIGAAVWLTNIIVFALWYWEFDRGGPAARAHARRTYPDFQFPQMLTPDTSHPDWEPTFVDYLYLSFTNATAFSPTDTMPMSRWAKMAMLTQSAVSLATVALVIARAVNILK